VTAPVALDGALNKPESVGALAAAFAKLALMGFGGVLPWAQLVLVEQRRWLSRAEFVEMLALAQLLPGPNIVYGDRQFGWRGSVAAMLGLLVPPFVLVMLAVTVFAQLADSPRLQRAMVAMGAVTAGMIIATALKLARAVPFRLKTAAFGVAAFFAIAWLKIPMAWVIVVLVPAAIAVHWPSRRGGDRSAR
jgi:chromate transporter